jgi:hypothetical protein
MATPQPYLLITNKNLNLMKEVSINFANAKHSKYANDICELIESAASARGTGIAKRAPEYIARKLENGNAVIALEGENLAGFCYIETWGHGKYVAHSGLIVSEQYRNLGLAKKIKAKAFDLSRKKFPESKVFGLTTSLAVMKINSELGYKPVTFSELTDDAEFWKGCSSCRNYDILQRTEHKYCLCTGMLYDPEKEPAKRKV